jgi:predicted protein tyrosine phosphatase
MNKTQSGHEPVEHRTADHYYAAYLKVAKVPLKRVDKQGRRTVFVFEGLRSQVEALQMEYYNRKGRVVALDFVDEAKNMKTLTYND